jgi:hypothetical protein
VKRGRRGQHHRKRPDDLRDSADGQVQPVRVGVMVTCELCGGPVPMRKGSTDGDATACLACGALHVIRSDDDCEVCQERSRATGGAHG